MSLLNGKKWYKWAILVVCILIYSSGNLVRWNYTGISSYLSAEWGIGKPEIGIMGAAYFYAYSIGQSPWGSLTDLLGGRKVIPIGIGITGIFFCIFSIVDSYNQALIVRTLMGFVGAATFIPCMAILSRWFTKQERGLTLSIFSGLGAGMGEVWSFLLMPLISLYMAGGTTIFGLNSWRASTLIMTFVVAVIAIVSYFGIRSDPSEIGLPSIQAKEDTKKTSNTKYKDVVLSALREPAFWVVSLVNQGFIVSLRLVPGWLAIYAAAFYIQTAAMSKAEAMVAGGVMATACVAGRIIGSPVLAKLCDFFLIKHKVPRMIFICIIHAVLIICLFVLTIAVPNAAVLGVLSFILGALINSYTLTYAAVTEIWSIKTGGALMGVVNMIGQFIGATALALSGFMAAKFSVAGGGYNIEYRGIWYLAMICCAVSLCTSLFGVYRERKAIRDRESASSMNL